MIYDKPATTLCLMKYLLKEIQRNNTFAKRLKTLMQTYPSVDPDALGFKENWHQEPLWR